MPDRKTVDPSTRQPSKAEMEETIIVKATLDELGTAVMRGGAPRREPNAAKSDG